MQFVFNSTTGEFSDSSGLLALAYSGCGLGKNNPACQMDHDLGPIPQGKYEFLAPADHPLLGPVAIPIVPLPDTELFGRSGFFAHGDSIEHPGEASHGCIILPRPVRELIVANPGSTLSVI